MLVRKQHAPFPALPCLTLCPPASASTVRSNLRGNAHSLPPLSAPAPWPCPAPCLLALPHLALPLLPGCRVSGLLSLRPLLPCIPPACTVQSNVRGNPSTPSLPFCPLVSLSLGKLHALCTAAACGLCPSSLPSLVARHYVGTLHTVPPEAGCLVAAGCGVPPCPVPPLAAGGQPGCGAPFSFLRLVRSFKPGRTMCIRSVSSMPLFPRLHLQVSALRLARARCGATCQATLPSRSSSLLRLPGPALPLLCPSSLALPCPPSRASGSLAFCLPVPVLPLLSGPQCAEQYAKHPYHSLFTFLPPGVLGSWQVARTLHCTRLRPFSLFALLASSSLPCPFPLPKLCRTLCRQVARMLQARTWLLSFVSSVQLAPRCGCPPLPQPPQAPLLRAATPNAAGGTALAGPGCPRARVSLYPRGAWSPGGIHHKNLQESKRNRHIYIHTHIYIYTYI